MKPTEKDYFIVSFKDYNFGANGLVYFNRAEVQSQTG